MRHQKSRLQVPVHHVQRSGTFLMLGAVGRRVRVLPLPERCGYRLLHQQWDDCFGTDDAEDVVVWWPWDPANPPGPSHN